MLIIKILVLGLLWGSTPDDPEKERHLFISPVKIPLALSANFGELRPDHFHSGIDIKTQGVTGKEIVAAADGYVYRISVTPGGFGKALYLRHPSGYSTVYGHLDSFIPDIDEYVKTQQYDRKSFSISLFPPKEKFTFKQGDLIAYSGNSGSSAGPHLHYEIRKSESENPVNPLLFEFGTGDDITPVIEKVMIYPHGKNSTVNGKSNPLKLNVSGGHGNYYIPSDVPLIIKGKAGIGIKTYDLLNDSYNKCAPYSVEMIVDSITYFSYSMDEFSFAESRYINSHIDYETYIRERSFFQRTFILPNDRLSVYEELKDRGIIDFSKDKTYHISLIVKDIHKNKSTISFKVQGGAYELEGNSGENNPDFIVMPQNRSNRFRAEGVSILLPSGSLYDTLFFTYRRDRGVAGMFSDVHRIHNKFTPLHKAFSLSIKPTSVPAGRESKLLMAQISDDFKKTPAGGSYSEGYVTADLQSFGNYYIDIDTVPPAVNANGYTDGIDLSGRKEMRIKITDDFSGIKSYVPEIDGKWALFEYDQKNNVIIYKFDPQRIAKGSDHMLVLKVTDNKDNSGTYNLQFKW